MRASQLLPGFLRKLSLFLPLLLFYSLTTIVRNEDWQDDFTFWSRTVQTSPQAAQLNPNLIRPYLGLGRTYLIEGLPDRAIKMYEHVLKVNPAVAKAHYGLGYALQQKGELDRSLEE